MQRLRASLRQVWPWRQLHELTYALDQTRQNYTTAREHFAAIELKLGQVQRELKHAHGVTKQLTARNDELRKINIQLVNDRETLARQYGEMKEKLEKLAAPPAPQPPPPPLPPPPPPPTLPEQRSLEYGEWPYGMY